jgi:hypothetical protein
MITAVADKKANRADLLLMTLSALGKNGIAPNSLDLERALGRLACDDQVGSYFREHYRQALVHRAVIETLAYLQTNRLIDSTLAVSAAGQTRIRAFGEIQVEVDRLVGTVLPVA